MVVGQPSRLVGRHAIDELQRPDAGFDRIGRHDLRGNLLVVAGRWLRDGLSGENTTEYHTHDPYVAASVAHDDLECLWLRLRHTRNPVAAF